MNSEPSPGDPLSPESERLLGAIPSTIGDVSESAEASEDSETSGVVSALMAQVAFEEQDVQDTLSEFFDWLARRFESDHWKLNERQARMLGRPSAQLANAMWAKLTALMPDIIARWCESTPGALAFLTAFGLVVVPKAAKQVVISRERAQERKHRVQPVRRVPPVAPVPARNMGNGPAVGVPVTEQ